MRVVYLYGALLCAAMFFPSWWLACQGGGAIMPIPDPTPPDDPHWAEHAYDGFWLFLGLAGMLLFAVLSVALIVAGFIEANRHAFVRRQR